MERSESLIVLSWKYLSLSHVNQRTEKDLKTFQLLDLSNCPFQLHVCQGLLLSRPCMAEFGGDACPRIVRVMSVSANFQKRDVRFCDGVHYFKFFYVRAHVRDSNYDDVRVHSVSAAKGGQRCPLIGLSVYTGLCYMLAISVSKRTISACNLFQSGTKYICTIFDIASIFDPNRRCAI